MTSDFLNQFISTIAYLIPLLGLVWKGAKLTAKIEQMDSTIKEKIAKFCNDHKDMQKEIETERKETDRDISAVLKTLNEIQKSIVRIETTLKIEDK